MQQTVFIVDDEPIVLDSMAALVESAGFHVETYGTAEEFLATFDRDRPGCLITDFQLPGMSGAELWGRLAKQGVRLPTIIISGCFTAAAERLWNEECVELLPKPFDPSVLVDRIQRALESAS